MIDWVNNMFYWYLNGKCSFCGGRETQLLGGDGNLSVWGKNGARSFFMNHRFSVLSSEIYSGVFLWKLIVFSLFFCLQFMVGGESR